jgi:hypothetical protein
MLTLNKNRHSHSLVDIFFSIEFVYPHVVIDISRRTKNYEFMHIAWSTSIVSLLSHFSLTISLYLYVQVIKGRGMKESKTFIGWTNKFCMNWRTLYVLVVVLICIYFPVVIIVIRHLFSLWWWYSKSIRKYDSATISMRNNLNHVNFIICHL